MPLLDASTLKTGDKFRYTYAGKPDGNATVSTVEILPSFHPLGRVEVHLQLEHSARGRIACLLHAGDRLEVLNRTGPSVSSWLQSLKPKTTRKRVRLVAPKQKRKVRLVAPKEVLKNTLKGKDEPADMENSKPRIRKKQRS